MSLNGFSIKAHRLLAVVDTTFSPGSVHVASQVLLMRKAGQNWGNSKGASKSSS